MPTTRHQVAADIATAFLPAKAQSVRSSISMLEALAIMVEARAKARMPDASFGAPILEQMRTAVNAAFDAQQHIHEAHAMLAPIRKAWKIAPGTYGPNDSPEDRP
ncbi:hypothetical protein [Sphingomonas sp. TZW2008]|uniref:hypothetical protein n=1 Tax=Sphingomonas sp. TZW2008 TaxID=1917973 RepID=UPI0011818A85|nr:hypothetical protein [Sphingomonas sp. TZW2008]